MKENKEEKSRRSYRHYLGVVVGIVLLISTVLPLNLSKAMAETVTSDTRSSPEESSGQSTTVESTDASNQVSESKEAVESTNQLVDPTSQEIEAAKEAAQKTYEKTGKPQTITALAATAPGNIMVTKDNVRDYFTLSGKAGDNVPWTPIYDPTTGLVILTSDDTNQIKNGAGNIPWNQAGYMQLNEPIYMDRDFVLSGKIQLLGQNYTVQADGIGFAFYSVDETKTGDVGGGLGISGLKNGFGFKFDTYHNSEYGDSDFNPFGSFVHNIEANNWKASTDGEIAKDLGTLTKGAFVDFTVSYNGTTKVMTVTYGNSGLTWTRDLSDWIGEQKEMNFSITASTGSNNNTQAIEFANFNYIKAYSATVTYRDDKTNEILQNEGVPLTTTTTNSINATENLIENESVIQTLKDYRSATGESYTIARKEWLTSDKTQPTAFQYNEDNKEATVYVVKTKKAKVKYQDYSGQTLSPDTEINLVEGKNLIDLTADAPKIDGYTLDPKDEKNKPLTNVVYDKDTNEYTLYYKTNVTLTASGTRVYDGKDHDGVSSSEGDIEDSVDNISKLLFIDSKTGKKITLKTGSIPETAIQYDSPDVGNYKDAIKISINDALKQENPEYFFVNTDSIIHGDFTITSAAVTAKISGSETKTYGEDFPLPTVTLTRNDGVPADTPIPKIPWEKSDFDFVSSEGKIIPFEQRKNVDTYKIQFSSAGTAKLAQYQKTTTQNADKDGLGTIDNYVISFDGSTAEYLVTPKPVTVTIADAQKIIEKSDPVFTASTEGVLAGDDLGYVFTREPGEKAGTYKITAAIKNPNYTAIVTDGTLTIIQPVPLPMTGGSGILPFLFIGITSISIGIFYFYHRKKAGDMQ